MARLASAFDASQVEPAVPRGEVLPPDDYKVQIVRSEMRRTRADNGDMLVLEMEVIEGEHARRHLWDKLNLVNPNQQTMEIAQRTLSSICHAVGVIQISDSEQLHFKPLIARVTVEPAGKDERTGYERKHPQNEVAGYMPVAGAAPVVRQPARQAPAGASAPARQAPPPSSPPAPPPPPPAAPVGPAPWRRGRVA